MDLRVAKPAFPLAIPIGRDGIGLLLRVVFFGSFSGPLWCSEMEAKMDPKWGRVWPRLGNGFGAQGSKIECELEFERGFEFELQLATDPELQLVRT